MKRKLITRTTLEQREVTIIRSVRRRTKQPPCPVCPPTVVLVTLGEAMSLAGVGSRAIYGWIESGSVHFTETSDGMMFICPVSLVRQV